MRTGTFDADASRKMFEALCKALPADVFDVCVPAIPLGNISSQAWSEVVELSPLLPAAASWPDLRSIRSSAKRLLASFRDSKVCDESVPVFGAVQDVVYGIRDVVPRCCNQVAMGQAHIHGDSTQT